MKTTPQARSFAAKELKEHKETKSGLCALWVLLWLSVFTTVTAEAATRYVDANSPSPASPYTTWATAARVIQNAVNAAAPDDQILVTNGVYATGGRAVVGTMTNRVAVTKRLTVRSVNGPEFTVIQGRQVPGTINGDGAIRCVYLTNGASLSGFTLTNGATRTDGDAPFEQWGGGLWCESNTAVVSNCVIVGNSALVGGGVHGGTLINCTLSGNSAGQGGGTYQGALTNCILNGNSARGYGGGAYGYTFLNNCTLTGNSAGLSGGGTYEGTLLNCIVYFNTAASSPNFYQDGGVLNYCCTTPLPSNGIGNITEDPQLASPSHLSAASPCRGAGSAADASGTDIDGEVWANPPSIGCDEYVAGAVTGSLSVAIAATYTTVLANYPVGFTALVDGKTAASAWEFAGGLVLSNQPYARHSWAELGDHQVIVRAYNESQPGGISATVTVHVVTQPVHYVAADSGSPVSPYTSWATAATKIQDAVEAATVPGALVLVTNGVYATGGRAVLGTETNRVAVDKLLTLRSVNGSQFTVISGTGAIRCAFLSSGASLSGFTLTNGVGGVWCESTNAVVSNCTITGNSGVGAYSGTLNNCALTGNSGRGAVEGLLNNCTLIGNSGGGAAGGTLNNCVLAGNTAESGGGAGGNCTLNRCTLTSNSADFAGGGADDCTLNNCLLTGNTATFGGGASGGVLNNCTLAGNSAAIGGGAATAYYYDVCTLNNCIVYFNSADEGANYSSCVLSYSCSTPLPPGIGNISADPQLASASHLSAGSPCRGAGSAAYAVGTDIDGEAWANSPSIGCDEYHAGAVTGPLSVGIVVSHTNVATGFPVSFTALIEGRTMASVWTFGDGLAASNQLYASHAWNSQGDYAVVLRAYNDSHPAGISATVTVHVVTQPVHYVAATGSSPVSPYTTWATAATLIQDAVDAATVPGALVLVTNGVYASGGRAVYGLMTNRVAVTKPLTMRSVNGPQFTLIQGRQVPGTTNGDSAIRCVYLTNGAFLAGFTLTNGATVEGGGGGVWCESTSVTVSNCTLTGNSAYGGGGGSYRGTLINCTLTANSADRGGGAAEAMMNNCMLTDNSARAGGGAAGGTLNNCRLIGNKAESGGGAVACTLNNCLLTGNTAVYGGGAVVGTLNNCTLTGNSASDYGGGAVGTLLYTPCTLNNCIVYFNTANLGANYYACAINYSCTTPLPPGVGNFTSDPQLANPSHLRANSPCRGAGNATYATGSDIDGEAWANPPSVGCDEFQAGAAAGSLNVSIVPAFTNVATGYPVELTAVIEGRTTVIVWDSGDGFMATNQSSIKHSWMAAGDYAVILRAYNDSHPAGISATVTVHVVTQPVHYVAADSSNPVPPFDSWATAATNIQDAVDAAMVTGALVLVNDGTYTTGGRAIVGTMTNRVAIDRPILVESVNGPEVTIIQGRKVPGTTNGNGAIRCVYLASGASLSGFTLIAGATRVVNDWPTFPESSGGGLWCESATSVISNCNLTGNSAFSAGGVYRGTLNNCTLISNTASGGGVYASVGGGAYFSTLNDCTLTGNSAKYGGGGAAWSTLNNCALIGNRSFDRGGGALYGILTGCTLTGNFGTFNGGGALNAILNNCTLSFNSAVYGGGAGSSLLHNCTLTDNTAPGDWGAGGGGADQSTLNNCIVYFNAGANQLNSTLNYSCTTPLPTSGTGNISDPPLFVGAGNLRLSPNSPCINAGNNAYAGGSTDLDGRPRIIGGTVDMGAYENTDGQTVNGLPWLWLLDYALPTDGSADYADSDVDGHNNWQEWKAWTIPTDALSVLKLLTPQPETNGMLVIWQSVSGQNYFLERAAYVNGSLSILQSNLIGQAVRTSVTDTNAAGLGPFFYRVGVQE